jgi:hypothetical protein
VCCAILELSPEETQKVQERTENLAAGIFSQTTLDSLGELGSSTISSLSSLLGSN